MRSTAIRTSVCRQRLHAVESRWSLVITCLLVFTCPPSAAPPTHARLRQWQPSSHTAAQHAGCLFTGFRSATGAAWSIHATRARTDDLPTAAAFNNCSFIDNTGLSSGGAIFVERSGALRLENCTFRGNTAPYGDDVAAEDAAPDVFSQPPITVHASVAARPSDGIDVPSRSIAAAEDLDFPQKDDEFDADIAAVRNSAQPDSNRHKPVPLRQRRATAVPREWAFSCACAFNVSQLRCWCADSEDCVLLLAAPFRCAL